MRTSNIIITITIIIGILWLFYAVYKTKNPINPANQIIGNSIIIEKELQHTELSTIFLEQDFDYYLNPHSDKTTITTDENILPHIYFGTTNGLINFGKPRVFEDYDLNPDKPSRGLADLKPSKPIRITIGINGIQELNISSGNYNISSYQKIKQHVKTSDTIHLDKLRLQSSRYHNIDLIVNAGSLIIDNQSFSKMKLSGKTDQLELKSERKGVVDASNLNSCRTNLFIGQSSDIQINASCLVTGAAQLDSKIINHSKASQNGLVLMSANYTEI